MKRRRQRRARRRCLAAAVALVALLVLAAHPAALAGDVFSNVGPASQVPGGSLMDAYPLGNYALDHHFSAVDAGVLSGVDVSGIAPTIAWFLASVIWLLTSFLAYATITLFTFAFSLDLIGGTGTGGGSGALAPVSDAVRSIYRSVFGEPWLVLAITVTGLWALWHALVRRRYTETAGALGMSVVFVVIALAFVTQPERTIGEASRWTNAMSGAFLSLSAEGNVTNQARAKRAAADQLFSLLVFEPWVVLQFGGREHCVRAGDDDDPESVAVRPLSRSPGRDAELSRRLAASSQVRADGKTCVNAANKYAPRFLKHSPGSDDRDAHHEALREGDTDKAPDADRDGYRLGPADEPAADAMGKDGQYQRLLLAIIVFAGQLGAYLLLGALSVAVILAQVLVLVLLAFAPVALVLAAVPGRGHDFFRGWLAKLAAFLVRKAIYSLILAILLAVVAAVGDASSNLGWLMSWGLQGAFFWAVFLWRKQLVGQLTVATTGHGAEAGAGAGRLVSVYALAHATNRLWQRHRPRGGHPQTGPHTAGARGGTRTAAPDLEPPTQRAAAPTTEPGARSAESSPQPSADRPPRPATTPADPTGTKPVPAGQAAPPAPAVEDTHRPGGPKPASGTDGHTPPAAGAPAGQEGQLQRGLRDDRERLRRPGAADRSERPDAPSPPPLRDQAPDVTPDGGRPPMQPDQPSPPGPPAARRREDPAPGGERS